MQKINHEQNTKTLNKDKNHGFGGVGRWWGWRTSLK